MSDSMPPADGRRREPGQSGWDILTASLMVHADLNPLAARQVAFEVIGDLFAHGLHVFNDNTLEVYARVWAREHGVAL